jgi:hypothetical protein
MEDREIELEEEDREKELEEEDRRAIETERKREGEYGMKNQQNSVHQKRRARENTEIANTQGGNGEIKQDERVNFTHSSRKTETKKFICFYILKTLKFHPG